MECCRNRERPEVIFGEQNASERPATIIPLVTPTPACFMHKLRVLTKETIHPFAEPGAVRDEPPLSRREAGVPF